MTAATLNGLVNAGGFDTFYYFDYGTTADYGQQTATGEIPAGDFSNHQVSFTITGLQPNTVYHFRVNAYENCMVGYCPFDTGDDMAFTTTGGGTVTIPPGGTTSTTRPSVVSKAASQVKITSAQLNGTVNPNGSATTYSFQYGTTTSYGKSAAAHGGGTGTTKKLYGRSAASHSAGSGTIARSESANVTGLMPGAIYHYRIVAHNAGGTSYGADRTFSTQAAIAVVGLSGCRSSNSAGVRIRTTSQQKVTSTTVTVDGRQVASSKHGSFSFRLTLSSLPRGGNGLAVTTKSHAGRTRHGIRFRLCRAAVSPRVRFTG